MISDIVKKVCEEYHASQNPEEYAEALRVVEKHKPKVIVEIGVALGGSLAGWCEVSNPELAIGIDPTCLHRGDDQQPLVDRIIAEHDIKIIDTYSENPLAWAELEKLLNGRKIDFLFIDGDHRYTGVFADWKNYKRFMNENSIVGFHDVRFEQDIFDSEGESPLFWERLKRHYAYDEFYRNSRMGIGMLYFDKDKQI